MHWSWQEFEALPLPVYEVLLEQLEQEARTRGRE